MPDGSEVVGGRRRALQWRMVAARAGVAPARDAAEEARWTPTICDAENGVGDRPGVKAAHRAMWAMGDYDRFARATVWELGPSAGRGCGVTRGQRVLDVAAGTGNVAIRAAMAGASVVASDLTPEHFEAGRRGAAAAGVELEWVEGDAEALPFDDGAFDVVTSCFGAMFAPNQQAVADELVRVCRPGGTIGMMNFTPEGNGGEFFALLAPYAPPPPPGAAPPVLWGEEDHVRRLFGDRVTPGADASHVRRTCSESAGLLPAVHGNVRAAGGDPCGPPGSRRTAAGLDRALLDAVIRWNQGRAEGPVEIPYEYLLVVAQKQIE